LFVVDILHSQRIIAEVIEMIRTSHLIHKGLINIETDEEDSSDLNFGNKLALLCGDYLLSTSFHEVARLNNFHVQEIISSSLRDLVESEFLGLRDKQNQPVPSKPLPVQKHITIPVDFSVEPFELKHILGNMKAEWTLRNILGGASLLGKCCQCSLILANHESHIQQLGYNFGQSLALAWQASLDKDICKQKTFSIVSAPVMLHLEHDPGFYSEIEKVLSSKRDVDYDVIRKGVEDGPALEKTIKLQDEFSQTALDVLKNFSDSESKTALVNIIKSL
jgi:decaprenyl-diphosphate synthase subunit 2